VSDIDEGDVPLKLWSCMGCGHVEIPNATYCPNCGAAWPDWLTQRWPYDGKPEPWSSGPAVTGGRHDPEMLEVKHAAERRIREAFHTKYAAFVVCTACGAFITNDKWQVFQCTQRGLVGCSCDAPLRVKRYTAPPPLTETRTVVSPAEAILPHGVVVRAGDRVEIVKHEQPERQSICVTPPGADTDAIRAWLSAMAIDNGWIGLQWAEEIDEHGNPMGRLTGIRR